MSLRAILAAFAFLFLASCGAEKQEAGNADPKTVEAVEKHVRDWADAVAHARWADLPGYFVDTPDLVWVENGAVRYTNRDKIEAAARKARAQNAETRATVDSLTVAPIGADAASVFANLTMNTTFQGRALPQPMILTAVLVRRDGRWFFLQGHIAKAGGGDK